MPSISVLTTVALIVALAASARAQTGIGQPAPLPMRQAESRSDIDAKGLLGTVCTNESAEPACDALADLSPDEAWVVLNYACRFPKWQSTAPCTTFRITRGGVLTFNLKTNEWSAQWEQASYPLTFDVAGVPTLRLRPRDAKPLKVLVEEVSPLIYSAVPGVSKEDDLAIVAGLKSFLALAGTGIQGLVETLAFASATNLASELQQSVDRPNPRSGRTEPSPSQTPNCAIDSPDVGPLAAHVTQRQQQVLRVGAAMRSLENALDRLETTRAAFIRVAQQAEDGTPVKASELVAPNERDLEKAYGDFDESTRAFVESTDRLTSCQPLLSAYLTLIGAPADGRVIHDLARRIRDIGGCGEADVAAVRDSIRANASLLAGDVVANPSVCTTAKLKSTIELHQEAMRPLVERLLNAKQLEDKVWTAIDKASGARKQVLASAATLTRQVNRGRRHTWNNTLIRALAVTRPNPELSWNKVQSHEIIVKADSPYVKELSLAHAAEEKHAYKLESAAGQLLGYGMGLVYTPLYESTYGAVAVPGRTTKVIAETERETRAGDLAAFLTYRFMEHWPGRRRPQPTLDFGVGLTSGRPAFFLGVGLEIVRAARIGFGWTAQRVSRLAEWQTPNVTIVSSADDIRTVKRFDTSRYYVSFTFALDSLSLFNAR